MQQSSALQRVPAAAAQHAAALALLLVSALAMSAAPSPSTPAVPPMLPAGPAPDPATISTQVLPAGDNRTLVVRTCAVCHPIDVVVARPRTQDEWDMLISRMVDHGAKATDEEQQLIFEYLVRNFGKAGGGAAPAP
jgi:hypothetical protein